MMKKYDRDLAVKYAKRWALKKNPKYANYENYGGDCTNYVSQCMVAGNIPMDTIGKNITQKWHWYSDNKRTPSWSSARYLYEYLMANNNYETANHGVYAKTIRYEELDLGDIVFLYDNEGIYHSMIITKIENLNNRIEYYISQHTMDLIDYPLSLKIEGKRIYVKIVGYH